MEMRSPRSSHSMPNKLDKLAHPSGCMRTDPSASLFLDSYERPAYADEVGLGAIFGELVACAIMIPKPFTMKGVNDSKQLKHEDIYHLAPKLRKKVQHSFGIVSCEELNVLKNMHKANQIALKRSVENLPEKPDAVFVDGPFHIEDLDIPTHPVVKGDARIFGIAVASIIAKDHRDHMVMEKYGKKYPYYHIESNKGYRSPDHMIGIRLHGIVNPFHRGWLKQIQDVLSGKYDRVIRRKYDNKWKEATA